MKSNTYLVKIIFPFDKCKQYKILVVSTTNKKKPFLEMQ